MSPNLHAQPVLRTANTISQASASTLLQAAIEAATAAGVPSSIAIHDIGGSLLAFARMDGAPVLTVGIAQDKSYSAASFGLPTQQWAEIIQADEVLRLGIVHTPRLTVFGGGIPIRLSGELLGGIGLSGGHYTQDQSIGGDALAACGYDTV